METTAAQPTLSKTKASTRTLIAAASIGNALEWFDLVIYGFFAIPIARNFFPASSETLSLVIALATFAISYIARPIGALALGSYADRRGRKAAMLVSIQLMMIGTAMIALMPSYRQIGIAAPILILVSRLIQGFSAGGEFGSTTALLVEHAPHRRGFMSSWQFASQGLTTVIASLFGLGLSAALTPDQLADWGWRIPFFFGLLIGPVGLYIRKHLGDGKEFVAASAAESPVKELLLSQKRRVALAVGILVLSTAAGYLILYLPTYAIKQLHLPSTIGFSATLLGGVILSLVTPVVGHLSDSVGRVRLMVIASLLYAVSVIPSFVLLTKFPSASVLLAVTAWLCLLKALYFGALPALMSEAFPVRTRATGLALSYNIGTTVFGGFTPMVITWLISITASSLSPGFYLVLCAAVSLVSLTAVRKTVALR
ncbi:MFS transporter [Paraburkholderia sp. XV]|uniref:MFS transporter n=1 Tax=Paraburkholderia sp. XV TaxID=2831520 RepID=UPI001CD333AC|nr:MFS transporter [Paraburkholderia sp. XV]